MQPRSPAVVHSNAKSDGGCQTYSAARESMETDPLKVPGESPRQNSVESLYPASGVLYAAISHILKC